MTSFKSWHMLSACLVLSALMLTACARAPNAASEPAASVATAPAPAPDAASTPATAPEPARPEDASVEFPPPTVAELPVEPSNTVASDLRCKTSADCAVKDVGSCCGYQPRCLNKDAQTFPEQVQAQCAKDGRAGICGFQEIAGCECVAGQCAAAASPGETLVQ